MGWFEDSPSKVSVMAGAQGTPSEWSAANLRMTVFPTTSEFVCDQQWWRGLFGEPADSVVSQPKKLSHQEEGEFHDSRLRLIIRPTKIDWTLTPPEPEELPSSIPTIGSFRDRLEEFVPLMNRWLEDGCPPIKRIAFGAQLVQPVETHKRAYSLLNRYLPFDVDPDSTDLRYRVNRKRASNTISELELNRLSDWYAVRMQFTGRLLSGEQIEESEFFAVNLTLDINSAAEHETAFRVNELVPLFGELIDLGCDIAERGDVP
jgi:hypothetical protein